MMATTSRPQALSLSSLAESPAAAAYHCAQQSLGSLEDMRHPSREHASSFDTRRFRLGTTSHEGLLEVKGRVLVVGTTWVQYRFELSGWRLRQFQPRSASETPRRELELTGVVDVPDRVGARAHRFDAICVGSTARPRTVCLAAATEEDKHAWLDALRTATREVCLDEHPRAAEFRRKARDLKMKDVATMVR